MDGGCVVVEIQEPGILREEGLRMYPKEVGMNKKPKFKKRYVLGEGYPRKTNMKPTWTGSLTPVRNSIKFVDFKWPEELVWKSRRINYPKYRLELVRVDKKK